MHEGRVAIGKTVFEYSSCNVNTEFQHYIKWGKRITSYAYTYVCTSIPEIGYLTKVFLHLCGMVIGLSQWGRKLPVNLVEA